MHPAYAFRLRLEALLQAARCSLRRAVAPLGGAALAALLALPPASGAFAQIDIYLQTEKAGRGKVPIVVTDIDPAGAALAENAGYVTSVLRNDLRFTGVFEPLQFVTGSDSLAGGKTAAALFKASLETRGGTYVIDARLLDYSSREQIFNKRYAFKEKARRTVAHKICDDITFFLVGERGIASTRLLFTRKEGEEKILYMIDYDGYGERRFTSNGLAVSPVWLDEKRFCYTSYRRGNPDCYIVDLEVGERRIISYRKGINIAGGYYGERNEIAMTLSVKGNSEVYLMDSAGEIVRRLTRNRAIDCSPTWSPNGRELAFVSDRTGNPQIYIMDTFGGNLRRLTRTGNYNTSPAWSPEGDVIACASRESGLYRLKLISPDGLVEENLFDDYLSYEDPAWAPGGRHIAATVRYGGRPWIVIINVETLEKRRLVQGESAAWSPLP